MTIEAKVVAHSVSPEGKEVITFNIKYGLIVHAEFLRHRLLSNSVKSNRAIPMNKLRKEVLSEPYVPVYFGAAQKGMVADREVGNTKLAKTLWLVARYPACFAHWLAEKVGAHKEWANRLLNPWQHVRATVTGTEWDNFYALRLHRDAQKDIQVIAGAMHEAHKESSPMELVGGQWHTPYVHRIAFDGEVEYYDNDGTQLTPEQAVEASVARCARSSYDNHDQSCASYSKDKNLYSVLITSKPTHGSPAEHQATPIDIEAEGGTEGVTHMSFLPEHRDTPSGVYWSGNLSGWVQARQRVQGHTIWTHSEEQQ